MPGLGDVPGLRLALSGVGEDEPVLPRMLAEPLRGRGVRERRGHAVPELRDREVDGCAKLVLGLTWQGSPAIGKLSGLFQGEVSTLGASISHPLLKEG